MIEHRIRHSGIYAYPECVVHNVVSVLEFTGYTVLICTSDLIEAGVSCKVTGEQKSRLDIVVLDVSCYFVSCVLGSLGYSDQETEP